MYYECMTKVSSKEDIERESKRVIAALYGNVSDFRVNETFQIPEKGDVGTALFIPQFNPKTYPNYCVLLQIRVYCKIFGVSPKCEFPQIMNAITHHFL